MNLAQLFNPVEKIVGLEITQGSIKAVLLEKTKKGELTAVKKAAAIPEGALRDGKLVNKDEIVRTLKNFKQGNKDLFKSSYIILALPPAFVFTDIMKFPPLAKDRLAESIKLNLGTKTLFPLEANEIHYDWQPVPQHDPYHQEVMLGFALKQRIQEYVDACEAAGLAPLAFEAPTLATARALANFEGKTGIAVHIMHEGIELSVVSGSATGAELRFSRFVRMPAAENFVAFKTFVKDQVFQTINFFEIEHPAEPRVSDAVIISTLTKKNEVADELAAELGLAVSSAKTPRVTDISDGYLVAFGAALRGLIPRQNDNLISLMPVGTEETYAKRRFLSYLTLWSDIVNTTAILFVLLFGATWFFLNTISQKVNTQLTQSVAATAISAQIDELEKSAVEFNALVHAITAFKGTARPWSSLTENLIQNLTQEKITIHSISATSPENELLVNVTAATRDAAIAFRKTLEKSGFFESVKMPFLGIAQKENITFTLTLKVKPTP